MDKKKLTQFRYFTDNESQNYLASHWPKGLLTSKRFDSNSILYKFIKALAVIFQVISGQIYLIAKNTDIDKTDELLTEWETSVKIPEILDYRDTLEGRREAVQALISKQPVYNIKDGDRVVDINTTYEEFVRKTTGFDIEIEMLSSTESGSSFPLEFPIIFDFSDAERHSIFIIKVPIEGAAQNNIFPMTFPVSFFEPEVSQETRDIIDKALKRIIPAFAVWRYEPIPST